MDHARRRTRWIITCISITIIILGFIFINEAIVKKFNRAVVPVKARPETAAMLIRQREKRMTRDTVSHLPDDHTAVAKRASAGTEPSRKKPAKVRPVYEQPLKGTVLVQ